MRYIVLFIFLTGLITCGNYSEQSRMNEGDLTQSLLLSHYKPVSLYNIPKTKVVKPKYPIIDVHSHPYAQGGAEIARWVKTMDTLNIEKSIILTGSTGSRFDSIYTLYNKYPDRFELWCGFDYTGYDQPGYGPKAVAELERCFKIGARGVGELGDKGKGLFYSKPGPKAIGMHIDDPRMDLLLQKCTELGMPINVHIAEPIWMYQEMDSTNDGLMNAYEWRRDNKEGELTHSELVNTLENAIKKHPKLTFIACHFLNCSYDLNRLGALLDTYPNLNADIAARYAETAPIPRFAKAFIEKYQDRLLYGTDMGYEKSMYRITFRILESADEHFYETNNFGYHWALNGFDLNDNTLKKLYHENARKLLNN